MWLMKVVVADGEEERAVAFQAASFSELIKDYTKFLRNNCIFHEDEVIDASIATNGTPFDTGMVSLKK
jgi:hypothetical protein